MLKHAGQHITSDCYLQSFLVTKPPAECTQNKNFESGVYISDPDLKGPWKMKGTKNSIFKETNFYTLKSSTTLDKLCVEKFLGVLETQYGRAIKNFSRNGKFLDEDIQAICNFVGAMFLRARVFQSSFQDSINQTVGFIKDFMGDTSSFCDYVKGYEDSSKKILLSNNAGKIIKEFGVHFLINRTNIPFITCDQPVIRDDGCVDGIKSLVGHEYCEKGFTKADKKPFFYMALTPMLAFVSSEMIMKNYKFFPYIEIFDENIPLRFFNLLQRQAKEHLISDRPMPLGSIEGEYRRHASWKTNEVNFIEICTEENRFCIDIERFEKSGNILKILAKNKQDFLCLRESNILKNVVIQFQGEGLRRKESEIVFGDFNGISDGILMLKDKLNFRQSLQG